jgi:hypothetical protein
MLNSRCSHRFKQRRQLHTDDWAVDHAPAASGTRTVPVPPWRSDGQHANGFGQNGVCCPSAHDPGWTAHRSNSTVSQPAQDVCNRRRDGSSPSHPSGPSMEFEGPQVDNMLDLSDLDCNFLEHLLEDAHTGSCHQGSGHVVFDAGGTQRRTADAEIPAPKASHRTQSRTAKVREQNRVAQAKYRQRLKVRRTRGGRQQHPAPGFCEAHNVTSCRPLMLSLPLTPVAAAIFATLHVPC